MHNVQVTPLIGLPQLDGWSHVTQNQSGNLVWALSLHGAHARNVGRDILDLISGLEPRDSADFYAVFQQVVLQAQFKDCQFSCAAIFVEGSISTCVTFHAQILLRRNGKIGTLLDGLHTTKVIQGKIITDDLYILATAQAVTFADEIKLKIKQGYDTDSVVTSLTPNLQLEENTSLAALAFIEISKLEDTFNFQEQIRDDADKQAVEIKNNEDAISNFEFHHEIDRVEVVTESEDLIQTDENMQDSDTHISIDTTKYAARASEFSQKGMHFISTLFKKSGTLVQLTSKKTFKTYVPFAIKKIKSVGRLLTQFVKRNTGRIISRDVYINKNSSRKIAKYIASSVILICFIGTAFGLWYWQRSKELSQVKTDLSPLESTLQNAQTILADQPIVARDTLLSILEQVDVLKQKYEGKSVAQKQLTTFSTQVTQLYEAVSGREELQALPLFHSVANIESRFITSSWTLTGSNLWLLDDDAKQVIRLNVDTKEGSLFTLNYEGRASSIAQFPESADVMLLTTDGIIRISNDDGATTTVLEAGSEVDGARLLGSYGTNVYIFNTQKQNIFRVGLDDDALGTPRTWIRSSQGIEYSQIYSLAIDGDIWLTDRVGKIVRMRSGQPQPFEISGLEKPFNSSITLYTRDNLDLLFIVEPSQNRLVILNKDGGFIREIVSSTFASVTSIVVSPDGQKLFAVSGAAIHEVVL